jgi:hypothetical protein
MTQAAFILIHLVGSGDDAIGELELGWKDVQKSSFSVMKTFYTY